MSRQLPLTPKERARRRKVVKQVGELLYGVKGWHPDLAAALAKVTQRDLTRIAVLNWMTDKGHARPIPDWVMDALPETVAVEAPRVRAEAEATYNRIVASANTAERVVQDAETALLLDDVIETIMGSLNEAESDA